MSIKNENMNLYRRIPKYTKATLNCSLMVANHGE